ncbi:hypothetical protein LguiA_005123 [Lonicera macranthoides]
MAHIIDTNEEETVKGKTVDVGRVHFETETSQFKIFDAPVICSIALISFPILSLIK